MIDFINRATIESGNITPLGAFSVILAVLLSLACSLLVSFFYTFSYRRRKIGSDIHLSFPLLSIAITSIFICIQFSLPLSLGLLGALSIVRFRTPVKDPEEIGFLMIVIATSLAAATFSTALMGIIILTALASITLPQSTIALHTSCNGILVITIKSDLYFTSFSQIHAMIEKNAPNSRIDRLSDREGVTTISYVMVNQSNNNITIINNMLHKEFPDIETDMLISSS